MDMYCNCCHFSIFDMQPKASGIQQKCMLLKYFDKPERFYNA